MSTSLRARLIEMWRDEMYPAFRAENHPEIAKRFAWFVQTAEGDKGWDATRKEIDTLERIVTTLLTEQEYTRKLLRACLNCEGRGTSRKYTDVAGNFTVYHCPWCAGTGKVLNE